MLGIATMLSAGAVVAGASAASAHTPSISASCQGVTASGASYEAKDTNTLTVTVDGVTQTKNFQTNFTLTVPVPQDGAIHQWSASVTTTNNAPGYSASDAGSIGPCGDSTPEAEKITVCHSIGNGGYQLVTPSKNSFYVGHRTEHDDIYPAGSIKKQGQTFPWNAQGDQALLATGCATPPAAIVIDQVAHPSVTKPTCDTDGTLVIPATGNVTWTGGQDGDGPGTYTLKAQADAGYQIRNGVQTEFTLTVLPKTGNCPVDCTTRYDFDAQKMWEVTWGYGFADRNGGAPTFTMQSNGGLVGLDGGPVPAYMTPGWHWLYVTDGANNNHTYQFADGTTRTVTVTFANGADGCSYPTIVWSETPPPPPAAQDAAATATPNDDATCVSAGTVSFALTNATWKDAADTTDGSRVAVADNGHLFAGGDKELTVTYTLAPQKSGQACTAPTPTPQDAVASATALADETCDRPGTVSFAITNATWKDASDTTDGSRVAVADAGHLFAGGVQEQTVTYTVNPKKSGADCVIPPQVGGVKVTAPPTAPSTAPPTVPVVTPTVEGVKHEAAAALPRTGTEAGWYGAAGILLLMMGSGLVLVTRRGTAKH